jgi:peptide/nickel transport system permease protein
MSGAVLRRARSMPVSVGTILLGLMLVIAAVGPWITPRDPLVQNMVQRLALPSPEFWLGTDQLGRDLFSRLLLGVRISIAVGFGSALLSLVIGTAGGLLAAFRGGIVDAVIMRASDVLLAFPSVLLAMVVATILKAGLVGVILAASLVSIPTFVRLAYATMLVERGKTYVEAAITFGGSTGYIISQSVLPNVAGPLAVQTAFTVANAIVLEAGLSFLGLGLQPPTPSLGLIFQEARGYLRVDPWFGICPGVVLIVMVLTLNAVADALRRRMDPRTL